MFSRTPLKIFKSNAFRLSLWYAVAFILGFAALLMVTYLSLSSAMAKNDREDIEAELAELADLYNAGGLPAIDAAVAVKYRFLKAETYFFRLADGANRTVKIYFPDVWDEFDLDQLERLPLGPAGDWVSLPAREDRFLMLATAQQLNDGRWFQVGMSSEEREETLSRFRDTMLLILFPLTVLGIAAGLLMALRSLRPVRSIIQTVTSILEGEMAARVTRSYNGDELDELARLFNEMLDKIKTLIEGMKGSLDNVAHDLRTPMTRLRTVAEKALQDDTDLKQTRDALSDCIEESDRILSMVTMLMDISEAETGTLTLNRGTYNLSVLVKRVVDMYEPVADEKGIGLTVEAPAELCSRCDGNRMSQAFANILDNAIKYTPAGGRVAIEVFQQDGNLCIRFIDTGTGIPADDLPKIWDRLFRGANARSQKGLGLGLSFVRAICEAHNGRVEAKSALGQGATFTITLPPA